MIVNCNVGILSSERMTGLWGPLNYEIWLYLSISAIYSSNNRKKPPKSPEIQSMCYMWIERSILACPKLFVVECSYYYDNKMIQNDGLHGYSNILNGNGLMIEVLGVEKLIIYSEMMTTAALWSITKSYSIIERKVFGLFWRQAPNLDIQQKNNE